MRQSKFTKTQIVSILKEADAGRPVYIRGAGHVGVKELERWPNNWGLVTTPMMDTSPTGISPVEHAVGGLLSNRGSKVSGTVFSSRTLKLVESDLILRGRVASPTREDLGDAASAELITEERDMRQLITALICASVVIPSAGLAGGFQLVSPTVKDNLTIGSDHVLNGFGCTGGNVSPELKWLNASKDTKSFAVTVYDPDAPTGSGWWHWLIFNIPPSVTSLPVGTGKSDGSGAPPDAIQSVTDFGQPGYGGPCPPPGDKPHRYIFTVFALKVDQLPLKPEASGAMVGYFLNQNAIAKASLTGLYGRKKE
jgi:Raf kinase inhibitor-like YbhB/YbcL family protein